MAVVWILCFATLAALGNGASVGKSSSDYDTIVVGMGSSGIAAASTLARAGRRVLALEAQGRLGGRVNTVPCGDGFVELGAEWIHGTEGSPTYELALQNNVTILPQHLVETVVLSTGELVDSDLVEELMTQVLEQAERPPTPQPLGQYITERLKAYIGEHHPHLLNDTDFITEFLSFADLIVDSYEGSDHWDDATTHGHYVTLGGDQDMSWHKNGYKTLFQILLNKYKNGPGLPTLTTKLNTEVTNIAWLQSPSGKVVVKTKDGAEYTADNVIVTVSVGVLKERYESLFTPSIPAKKVTAIQTISIGVVNKIVLFFPERWWPDNYSFGFLWKAEDKKRVPEEDRWTTKIAGVSPPMGCGNALTLWTNGVTARYIETLSEDVVKTKSMELLKKFLGANFTITEPTSIYRTTWFSNPYTRGSYSFDNTLTPQHPTARSDLMEPLVDSSGTPRLLFAGEASNPTQFSTVHGAVASGLREASRLLRTEGPASEAPSVGRRIKHRGSYKRTSA